jgi:outer membrane protein assembly factor BamB
MRNMTGLITAITALVFLLSTGISAAEDCECVIITHPDFVGECEILADWKTNTGISTRVANTTWINDNFEGFDGDDLQAKIKSFIYYSHDRDDTRYVILAGDVDRVPTRYTYVNDSNQGDGKYVPCDLYYADVIFRDGMGTRSHWDMNGDGLYGAMGPDLAVNDTPDMRPDVSIGRLPASSKAELNTLIDKIVKYEINAYNPDWVKKTTLVADNDCFSDFEDFKDQTEQYFTDWGVPSSDIQKLYGASCTAENIQDAINEGRRFVNYAGHGGLKRWSCSGYANADAASLTNGEKTPIIAAKACYTAGFDMPEGTGGIDPLPQPIDDECIGETFLLNPNGGGITYLGATRVSYHAVNKLSGLVDKMFWKAIDDYDTVGKCWKYAITKEAYRDDPDIKSRKVLTEYVLLGDPTLRIRGRLYEDWHMLNHDPQRSGRSALKGDLSGTMHYTTILDSDKVTYPAVADIDGDGKQEIIISNEDTVRAFEGNGDHIWTCTGITAAKNTPTIRDVDDDGEQEVVVETHNSKLYILDAATGDYEWEYTADDIVVSPPIVADIDCDGKQEIVFGDGYYLSEDRHIYALNGDTRDELWKVTPGGHNIWQAMADVDSDGKQEIIGVNGDGVFALNAESGSILWQKEYRNAVCLPTIADLDNDGELEIAFGTWYYEGFGGTNRLYVIDAATGDLEWYYDLNDWPGQSSAGDVDGDGVLEIVFNTLNQDIYCLDRYDGWVYPRDGNGAMRDDLYIISAVAIADVDNDNNLEIIVGSTEGYLDILSGSGSLEKRYNLGGIVENPAIGDVDDDGKAEIVVKNGIIGSRSSSLGAGSGMIYAETSSQKANSDVIHAKTEIFKPDNRPSSSKTSSGVIWYNHVPIVMNASINAADLLATTVYASDSESNAVLVLSGPDPDLVMATSDISFDPVSPTTADIVTITATVHNQRDDSFTNKPFKISFYDEEHLIGDDLIVASIPPAGEVNASVEWYHPGSGTHNISVIVDSGHSIPETDETNNEAENEVVVLPTIHTVDAVLALQMAAGSIPADPAADVNSDGAVTSLDALLILQYCKTQ